MLDLTIEELRVLDHLVDVEKHPELYVKIQRDLKDEIEYERRNNLGPLTKEQKAEIAESLIAHIVHGMPEDLIAGHGGDWFIKQYAGVRGEVARWNFANSHYPIRNVAEKLGYFDEYLNTTAYDVESILTKVKRSKQIQFVKNRAEFPS